MKIKINAEDLAAKLAVLPAADLKSWKLKASEHAKGFSVVDKNGTEVEASMVVNAVAEEMTEEDLMQESADESVDSEVAKSITKALEKLADSTRLETAARIKALHVAGGEVRNDDKKQHGFKSMADFGQAVMKAVRGDIDDRLRTKASLSTYANESVGADGGFAVPPMFREEIWKIAFDDDGFIGSLSSEPTSGNSVTMAKTETTPWGATGIQAYWESEASSATQSKPVLQDVNVRLNKLMVLVPGTDEVLDDAPRLQNLLTIKAGQAINYKLLDSVVNGDGVGKPQGYMNSGSLVTVAKESGQAADTVVAANVAKIYSRCLNPSQAVWRINQDVLPQLLTMTLGDQPIWTPPSSGFVNAPGGYLFGRPVQFSEPNATVGDLGDIALVNPYGYAFVTKQGGGVDFQSSMHLWFDQGTTAFRWTFRAGGQTYLAEPVTPAKGSATRSHVVVLAARA